MAKIIFNQFVDLKHCWNYPNKKNSMLFKLKETSKDVYFIDHYCRSQKKYCCCKFEDVNFSRYFKGDKKVFIDFEF
jgi:hypothetical protein|tara:strand:- start:253 stop:480 length:228 start_codon:yes stop_codon:yes gene_type:complete